MKRAALIFGILCIASAVFAGFKAKNFRPKKPEQFQSRVTMAGATYAADLLLDGKDQKSYFYKELTPSNVIAVRLAIFNNGNDEVILPISSLELLAPDGKSIPIISPELVAQAVLPNKAAASRSNQNKPWVGIGAGGSGDPRRDPSDPRYDPRLDPNGPNYDPNDPRNRGQYPPGSYPPGSIPGTYPPGSYPSGGTLGRVIIRPGGDGDLSKYERELAEKDFRDKAHTSDPVPGSASRDRFLYFSIDAPPGRTKGYTLRLPVSRGIPQEVIIRF